MYTLRMNRMSSYTSFKGIGSGSSQEPRIFSSIEWNNSCKLLQSDALYPLLSCLAATSFRRLEALRGNWPTSSSTTSPLLGTACL